MLKLNVFKTVFPTCLGLLILAVIFTALQWAIGWILFLLFTIIPINMQIIQFLVGFITMIICGVIFARYAKQGLIKRLARLIIEKKAAAIRAQNSGGNADEYLRLEGEIRAYNNLFK